MVQKECSEFVLSLCSELVITERFVYTTNSTFLDQANGLEMSPKLGSLYQN